MMNIVIGVSTLKIFNKKTNTVECSKTKITYNNTLPKGNRKKIKNYNKINFRL